MKAIMLCAGMGTRLQPFTDSTHKALFPIKGRPMIEHTLEYLHSKNITDITIVVGYYAEQFEYLTQKYGVELRVSTKYQTHNNYSSMQLVLDKLNDAVVLEGDCYFVDDFIERIDTSKNQFFGQKIRHGEEWGFICDENDRLKDLVAKTTEGWGEIGVSYWTGDMTADLEKELAKAQPNEYWEESVVRLMDKHAVYGNKVDGVIAFEFDKSTDVLFSGLLTKEEMVEYIKNDNLKMDTIGMTNKSYYNEDIFIKLVNQDMNDILDRDRERKFRQMFYEEGITPKLYVESNGYTITERIHGFHPSESKWVQPIVDALAPIHNRPHHETADSVMEEIEKYLSKCSDKSVAHPEFNELIKELDKYPASICHGDLLTGNMIIDKNEKVWFIDFEYPFVLPKYWDIVTVYLELDPDNIPLDEAHLGFAIAIDYWQYVWSRMDNVQEIEFGTPRLERALKNFEKYKNL